MRKPYVYQITNLINNKIYIGAHNCLCKTDCRYKGSGVRLNKAYKKYGKENFIKTILFEFDTFSEALIKEKELVSNSFVARIDTYNVSVGGSGRDIGRRINSSISQKISNTLKGRKLSKTHRENIRKNTHFRLMSKESHDKTNAKNRGQKRTPEQLARIRYGRHKIITPGFEYALDGFLTNGNDTES